MHKYIYTYIYIHIYKCMYKYIYTYIYIYIYIHTYKYIYIYIYILNTCIHIYHIFTLYICIIQIHSYIHENSSREAILAIQSIRGFWGTCFMIKDTFFLLTPPKKMPFLIISNGKIFCKA